MQIGQTLFLATRNFLLLFVFFLSGFESEILANGPPKHGFDVYYYELDVEIDIPKKSVQGKVKMHFSALSTLKVVRIDLYRNLKIDAIFQDTLPLNYQRKGNVVLIHLKQDMLKGSKASIEIQYHGYPLQTENAPWQGGFVWNHDSYDNPWLGVACQTYGASIWWPVKDDLEDEPDSMLLQFTVPFRLDMICLSNGQLIERRLQKSSQTFVWKTQYPINVYNVTFYIGAYKHFSLPYAAEDSSRQLDFFLLQEHLPQGMLHLQQAVSVMQFLEKKFGEYPWWKDGFKLIVSPYYGMEHQTAISYGNNFQNIEGFPFDDIIVHEIAHEWWGNSVTVGDFRDIWLQEGMATYCEALYAEEIGGMEAYMRYIKYLRTRITNQIPLSSPTPKGSFGFQGDVYTKGALLLHTLRLSMEDDSLFFDILKTFYTENRYAITSTKEFVEVVNRKSGRDYYPFFDLYLNEAKRPSVKWNFIKKSKKGVSELYYQLNTEKDSLFIPFQINVSDTLYTLHASNKLQVLVLAKDSKVEVPKNNSYARIRKTQKLKPKK